MELCHCRYCKAIFYSSLRRTCCDKCQHIDNERFETVREYLELHPRSNAIQIADSLDIDVSEILRYIDEGRLYIAEEKKNEEDLEAPVYKLEDDKKDKK